MSYRTKEIVARIKAGQTDKEIAAVLCTTIGEVQLVRDVVEHPELFRFDTQWRVCLVDPRNG